MELSPRCYHFKAEDIGHRSLFLINSNEIRIYEARKENESVTKMLTQLL